MHPRPIADTAGPCGPSVRCFMAAGSSPVVRARSASRYTSCPLARCSAEALHASVRAGAAGAHIMPAERPSLFPLNIPNLLTVLRIMLVPVLVVALLGNTPGGDVLAAVVFAAASATDFVDGYLAR